MCNNYEGVRMHLLRVIVCAFYVLILLSLLSLRSFPRIDINSTKQRPLLAAAAAVTITNKQSKMKLVSSSLLYVKSN